MNWNKWIRASHRRRSIVFTLAVVIHVVAMVKESQAVWSGFLALAPLTLLMCSGLYLFVLPYAAKRRSARLTG